MTNTTIGDAGTLSQQLLNTMNGTSSTSGSGSSSSASGTSSTGASSSNNLQQTFLTLLVTQLKNQDPMNPMDSSQMTSQLAQINTVTGISQLNTTLTSLASQLSAGQNAQASLLIGQNVLVPGSTASVSNGASAGFGVQVAADVTDLTVSIKNAAGQVVNTVDLGAQKAGMVPVSWKPTDSSGNPLPDGTYTLSAVGRNGLGSTTAETTLTGAQVQSVVQQSGGATGLLLQNGSTVNMSSVVAIL